MRSTLPRLVITASATSIQIPHPKYAFRYCDNRMKTVIALAELHL